MKRLGLLASIVIFLWAGNPSAVRGEDNIPQLPWEPDVYTMALWHFDEGQGKVVKDATTFRADGILDTNTEKGGKLPEWVPGKFGKALRFHGQYDVVTTKKVRSLEITGPLTIEAWLNFDDPTKTAGKIVVKKSTKVKGGYALEYRVYKEDRGLRFELADGKKNYVAHSINLTKKLKPGVWYYVAAVYDGKRMYIYLNGNDVTKGKPTCPGLSKYPVWPVRIGGYASYFNGAFRGIIDEVRISNTTRDIKSNN